MKASPPLSDLEGGGFNRDIAAAATMAIAAAHAKAGRLPSTKPPKKASAKLEESFLTARHESIFSTEAAPSIAKDSERNGSPLISGRGASTIAAVMSSKVGKRSFKKSNKSPIKVLSADTTNFRALVHQYTAKPTSPSSCQSSGLHLWDSPKLFMRPPPPFSTIPGLPTLDTSASLLGPPNQATPLQGYSILSSLPQSNPPFDAAKHGLKHNINHVISEIHPCLASNNPSPNPNPYLNRSTFVPSRTSMPSLCDPADGGHLRAGFFTNKLGRETGHPQDPYSGMFADASSLNKQASNIDRFLRGG